MSKRYDEEIEVTDASPGVPVAFAWRGRRYDVDQPLATWMETWADERDRAYVRVLAHPRESLADGAVDADGFLVSNAAVYDLYLDRLCGCWRLARVWD